MYQGFHAWFVDSWFWTYDNFTYCKKYAIQRNEPFNSIFIIKNLRIANTHVLLCFGETIHSATRFSWIIFPYVLYVMHSCRVKLTSELVPNPFGKRSCNKMCSNQIKPLPQFWNSWIHHCSLPCKLLKSAKYRHMRVETWSTSNSRSCVNTHVTVFWKLRTPSPVQHNIYQLSEQNVKVTRLIFHDQIFILHVILLY